MSGEHFAESFQKARAEVVEALSDQGLTTGAAVSWDGNFKIGGNLAHDDPALSPLYVDDLGRLWKERHHGGSSSLECVLDLRTFGP